MIDDEVRMVAYPFRGYWKDVGTIESLWEANMDLLSDKNEIDLHDTNWSIFSNNKDTHSQYVGKKAVIKNSLISDGCVVEGKVINSVISKDVEIGYNTIIKDSVILPGAKIGENVIINKSIISSASNIDNNSSIGDGKEIIVVSNKVNITTDNFDLKALSTV